MIYVVRHGETDWNNKKLIMGRRNEPLNEKGIRQAKETKEKLKDIDLDLIICSPLKRTKQTAAIINEDRLLEIILADDLQERSMGDLEEKPYLDEEENKILWDIKAKYKKYNVETMELFSKRIYSLLERIKEEYSDKNVLLVTHGGVSAVIKCYFENTLYDGSVSNKFLGNCQFAEYNTKQKVLK